MLLAKTKLLTPNLCFMCFMSLCVLQSQIIYSQSELCVDFLNTSTASPTYFLHVWVATCGTLLLLKSLKKELLFLNELVLELVSWKNEGIKCIILGLESNLSMHQLALRNEKSIYVIGWYYILTDPQIWRWYKVMNLSICLTSFYKYRRMFYMQESVQLVLSRSNSGEHSELTLFFPSKMIEMYLLVLLSPFCPCVLRFLMRYEQILWFLMLYEQIFSSYFLHHNMLYKWTMWLWCFWYLTALLEKIREVVKSIDSLMLVAREMRGENGSIFLKELQL